jgi:hypothetical protein
MAQTTAKLSFGPVSSSLPFSLSPTVVISCLKPKNELIHELVIKDNK